MSRKKIKMGFTNEEAGVVERLAQSGKLAEIGVIGVEKIDPETGAVERIPFPKARSIQHDNTAGIELISYSDNEKKIYELWLRFRDGKPSDAVRAIMKEEGFKWHSDAPKGGGNYDVEGAWTIKRGFETRRQDTLKAEQVYKAVVVAMRKEKGIEPEPSRS